jgi:reactive intermediate/imine deaminase
MTKTAITTEGAPHPAGGYSQGITATGALVFTAGMGPIDPETGGIVGESIEQQTHRAIDNIEAVLAARGLGLGDVVKATVHLQYLERDFAAYDAAYKSRFPEPLPARTTVGSQLMGFLVEIDVVAVERS